MCQAKITGGFPQNRSNLISFNHHDTPIDPFCKCDEEAQRV